MTKKQLLQMYAKLDEQVKEIKKQFKRGTLTPCHVRALIDHRDPFEDSILMIPKWASIPEAVRLVQIKNLKKYGYSVNESEVPVPDEKKFMLRPVCLADYEISIDEQCRLLGIENWLNLSYHRNLRPKPKQRWGWIYEVEDGKKMLSVSPNNAVIEFKRNNPARRGLMTVEGLALYRENPNVLQDHYIHLSGSRYNTFRGAVPCLFLFNDQPKLYCDWDDHANQRCGSASVSSV